MNSLSLLGFLLVSAAHSQEPAKPQAFNGDKPVDIQIPSHLRKKGGKLRIKNLVTGKEAILDISDENFISSDVVKSLTDGSAKKVIPEFSVLDSIRKRVDSSLRTDMDPALLKGLNASLVFDQPIWRRVPFKASRGSSGRIRIDIDPREQPVVVTAQVSEQRRELQEDLGLKKLFEAGWKALNARQYNVGLEAFDRILKKSEALSSEQLIQASLGRGISKFHQEGCAQALPDLDKASQDPRNSEDVGYYRGLCWVESKEFEKAEAAFKELSSKNSAQYAEPSRFYLGVIAENTERFDDAESAYLDTIDFASEPRLVTLAKERLEAVKQRKLEAALERKWFTILGSIGLGFDSNVISLPQGLSPSDYNVSDESSASLLGLAAVEFKVPYKWKVVPKLRYSFLALHYATGFIATSNDIQSHDAGLVGSYTANERSVFQAGLGYNSVFLGPLSTSGEYLSTASFDVHWSRLMGDPAASKADMDNSLKVGFIDSKRPAASAALNQNAQSYLYSLRYNVRHQVPSVFGPGVDIEYRPSRGSDNTYAMINILGHWSRPVGPESWGLSTSQEGDLQTTFYYKTASDRRDMVLRYTGSVARVWFERLETRLQFVGTLSFSSVPAQYRYNRAQINFLVSAFY